MMLVCSKLLQNNYLYHVRDYMYKWLRVYVRGWPGGLSSCRGTADVPTGRYNVQGPNPPRKAGLPPRKADTASLPTEGREAMGQNTTEHPIELRKRARPRERRAE